MLLVSEKSDRTITGLERKIPACICCAAGRGKTCWQILNLYREDFFKIDPSGRISMLYHAIPSQLALKRKRFTLSSALGKRTTSKDQQLFADLLNSRAVLPCYEVTQPNIALAQTMDLSAFKLYLADTGLFISQLFQNDMGLYREIYQKLLSNKLDTNLGFLYENIAAQVIGSSGRKLYYHTWAKPNSTHRYEIDFLIPYKMKIIPLEIKSSPVRNHQSMDAFLQKYSAVSERGYLFSQKDVSHEGSIRMRPIYMLPFLLEECDAAN